ncbi:MAG: lytic transglycosylase domain-containing protein [Thermodesulfobacteriota bacterium]
MNFPPPLIAALLLALLFVRPAAAEIYTFVDEKGTIHFSNAPRDSRFTQRTTRDYLRKHRRQIDIREYDFFIRGAADKFDLDPLLVKAVIQAESNFDCYALSQRGARGLMQLMPATAGDMQVENSYNARENIEGGSRYLRKMLDMFNNNIYLALAAYNAGPGNVQKYQAVPPFPETVKYVRTVLKNYALNQQQVGPGK